MAGHRLSTATADTAALRQVTRNFYDLQKLRIMEGNRLVGHFRIQLGQEPGTPTDDLSEEAQGLIARLKEEYVLFGDAVTRADPRRWHALLVDHEGLITTQAQLILTQQYMELEEREGLHSRQVGVLVRAFPIWDQFLEGVRGCGPIMAAVLISELDPHKARHASSFWRYAGLDVGDDGRGRSKRADHLVTRPYTTKDGTPSERLSITYNPFLKTKLMGVLAGSFLRSASPYRAVYDGYKHRLENHAVYGVAAEEALSPTERKAQGITKGRRHMMAQRYMVKIFLLDLWKRWRALEGLPVGPSYAEALLGHTHGEEAAG